MTGIPLARRKKVYFAAIFALAVLYLAVSFWLSRPWHADLAAVIGFWPALFIIAGIAYLPGFLNAFLFFTLLWGRHLYEPLDEEAVLPPLAVLIAAYNEEKNIGAAIDALRASSYPGPLRIIVVDDGSTDGTERVLEMKQGPDLVVLRGAHRGKAAALNLGLAEVWEEYFVTIDADTVVRPHSLEAIVRRLLTSSDYGAVAGHVLARNNRDTSLTRLQDWDYSLGIASIKYAQGAFECTLVAQGAFSAYRTEAVRRAGGWPDRIGEDIVLTWNLFRNGYRVGHEPTALAFTEVPERLRRFGRQRQRWARGMIEGLREYLPYLLIGDPFVAYFVSLNLLFPYLDLIYTLAFIPGVILALWGRFYLVGPMTLLVLPLAVLQAGVMMNRLRSIFEAYGLKIRRNFEGLVGYLLLYQFMMSPICLTGYLKELFSARRVW